MEIVARILQAEGRGLTMIFTRTKRNATGSPRTSTSAASRSPPVHGDLGQGARERALRAFRVGKIDVLVATDVAARGLDVTGVTPRDQLRLPGGPGHVHAPYRAVPAGPARPASR